MCNPEEKLNMEKMNLEKLNMHRLQAPLPESAWRSCLKDHNGKDGTTSSELGGLQQVVVGIASMESSAILDPSCVEESPCLAGPRLNSRESPRLPVSWLADWEAKQERLLRQHQDNTRQLVHSLRKDMLRRFSESKHTKPSLVSLFDNFDAKASMARDTSLPGSPVPSEKHHFPVRDMKPGIVHFPSILAHRSTSSRATAVPFFTTEGRLQLERLPREVADRTASDQSWAPKASMLSRQSVNAFASDLASLSSFPRGACDTPGACGRRSKAAPRPQSRVRGAFHDIVHSRCFSIYTSFMIAMYTVAVGVMADMEMRSAVVAQDCPFWLWYVDLYFATSFAMEVLLRMISDGKFYFSGTERKWNFFDMGVALVGVADLAGTMDTHLGFIRILRACRAVRVLRVLRQFPMLKELRVMAESICSCITSLAWALALLGSVQYIFAVVLLRGASEKVRGGSLEASAAKVLSENFGNLAASFISLTEAVSGGRSWAEYSRPFMEVNPVYGGCFPLYVIFIVFGAVNILTGIFVESTSCIANYDKELAVEEELSRFQSAINQIRDFFEELDTDGSGTLSFAELEACLLDERVRAYFSVLHMDVHDPHLLFQLLDKDGTGDVSIEEFIEECLRLKGSAKALDMAAVMRESRCTRQQMKAQMTSLEERFDLVCKKLLSEATAPEQAADVAMPIEAKNVGHLPTTSTRHDSTMSSTRQGSACCQPSADMPSSPTESQCL